MLRDELHRKDFHCVVMGGGPHRDAIIRYAEEQGVADVFTFMGRVSDDAVLCRILSSADLAIDAAPKNAWSNMSTMNKIVEYMYFGLPIVAFDLGENRTSAARAAVYVESGNEAMMAQAINELLDDAPKRGLMGAFGYTRLREVLAWQHSVPCLLKAYDAAWAIRTGPRGRIARTVFRWCRM
jgi:glycosyltransferase involved in cell wall biosynthesis